MDSWVTCLSPELRSKEKEAIAVRRARSGSQDDEPEAARGVALSGGGIPSATFCLGVLQSFARAGQLGTIDYLSTVLGGGYIGGPRMSPPAARTSTKPSGRATGDSPNTSASACSDRRATFSTCAV
jgi:hypothetical protein